MSLKIAIVGLPNVGKSTLFNALTKSKSAQAENYPFCTIDPNVGIVEVPDERLKKLAAIYNSEKIIPAVVEFVDIAGLVKGASTGEGLGNKFLAHIRECDAIAHIVRLFDDSDVIHVHGQVNPKIDKEVIESELMLADIQTLEKRLDKSASDAKSGVKEKKDYYEFLKKITENVQKGILIDDMNLEHEDKLKLYDLHLMTTKPRLYIVNLSENQIKTFDKNKLAKDLEVDVEKIIPICAKVEEELNNFSPEESKEYLSGLGLEDTGLNALIKVAYSTLGLMTFLTSGPKETRAWTIHKGDLAPKAAGAIHTDFEKGFIKAEVINWEKLIQAGGDVKAREQGLMRMEGKTYVMQDGDTVNFKFSN